jgi:hypothetical protein
VLVAVVVESKNSAFEPDVIKKQPASTLTATRPADAFTISHFLRRFRSYLRVILGFDIRLSLSSSARILAFSPETEI